MARPRIAIVGGGASGAIMAANLARQNAFDVVLIEREGLPGHGLAYATAIRDHLLNVCVSNMSALADQPNHFFEWLQKEGASYGFAAPEPHSFVPRRVYGAYLNSLVGDCKLSVIKGEVLSLNPHAHGVSLTLADGHLVAADRVILATGNEARRPFLGRLSRNPWEKGLLGGLEPNADVLVIGTGLTMVDVAIALQSQGHRGRITALSRRGLLANQHRMIAPLAIPRDEVPFGAPISELLRWLRTRISDATRNGYDWRAVIDGLRPHTQILWLAMGLEQRRRFLRHGRPYWDVCRHRMAPEIAARIAQLSDTGQLRVLAARVDGVESESPPRVRLRHRKGGEEIIEPALVLDCTGLPDDPAQSVNPVIASLYAAGLVRSGPLSIGLDLDAHNALIDANGAVSQRLFAIGPLVRGMLWESIAVPDIRNQCAALTKHFVSLN